MKRARQVDDDDNHHQEKKAKIQSCSRKRKNDNLIVFQPCKKMKLADTRQEQIQHRRDILLYL